jgi:hypothetical protein
MAGPPSYFLSIQPSTGLLSKPRRNHLLEERGWAASLHSTAWGEIRLPLGGGSTSPERVSSWYVPLSSFMIQYGPIQRNRIFPGISPDCDWKSSTVSLRRISTHSVSGDGLWMSFVAVGHVPTLPYSGFFPPRVPITAVPVHVQIPTRSTCALIESKSLEQWILTALWLPARMPSRMVSTVY